MGNIYQNTYVQHLTYTMSLLEMKPQCLVFKKSETFVPIIIYFPLTQHNYATRVLEAISAAIPVLVTNKSE